ncbi:MAG: hypothetical protein WAW54_09885 [Parvibaculum sedimenti]|uniref:hypothetical protein n=1 Tax=Parvibaculum sedimenti TaxID=2608632 RepID=UPI003BB50E15
MTTTAPATPHLRGLDPLALHEEVLPQIEALSLVRGKPIIVSDCDEVLMQFIAGLELYLETQGLWLDLQSFALTGNIKRRDTGEALPASEMPALMQGFFASSTHSLIPVPGAAKALTALSNRAQVVVLTNVPFSEKETRVRNLAAHGMAYPVIANKGLKGGAVKRLAEIVEAPVVFLDDIPHNLASVAAAHAPTHRVHFIADQRLAKLLGPSEHSHFHTTDWAKAHDFISARLEEDGF